jgi:hypothetical protein
MKISKLISCCVLILTLGLAGITYAKQDHDRDRDRTQLMDKSHQMDRDRNQGHSKMYDRDCDRGFGMDCTPGKGQDMPGKRIYGYDMMSEEERMQFRKRVMDAGSEEERNRIREEHRIEMRNRNADNATEDNGSSDDGYD